MVRPKMEKIINMKTIQKTKQEIEFSDLGELQNSDYISKPRINYEHLAKVIEAKNQIEGRMSNHIFTRLARIYNENIRNI